MSMQDAVLILVFVFVFAICTFIAYYVDDQLIASGQFTGQGQTQITGVRDDVLLLFDEIIIVIAFLMSAVTVVLAFLIRSNPVFLVLWIIFLIIIIPVAGILSDAFNLIIAEDEFSTVSPQFPYMVVLLEELPKFALVFSIVIGLAMMANPPQGVIGQ